MPAGDEKTEEARKRIRRKSDFRFRTVPGILEKPLRPGIELIKIYNNKQKDIHGSGSGRRWTDGTGSQYHCARI